jgi:hypothetical protein
MPAHSCGSNQQSKHPEKYGAAFKVLIFAESMEN